MILYVFILSNMEIHMTSNSGPDRIKNRVKQGDSNGL